MKELILPLSVAVPAALCIVFFLLLRSSYAVVAPPPPKRDYRVRVVEAVLLAEARGEGPGGVERVAEVIRNRMVNPAFYYKDAINIVTAPYQFSCLNGITTDILLEQREAWSAPPEVFNAAQRCAYQLVFIDSSGRAFGKLGNKTNGATHFHTAGPKPKWAGGRRPVHTYKNHIFYRLN